MRFNPCHATDFRPATCMICVKHRTQTAVGIKQMYSKFFKIPPKSLIPKWFPDGFLYIPWSCYRGALGAPKNSEINHRSIAPPSLRAQHPGATSSGVAGPANWTLEKWQVRQVPKNEKKKWPDWSCFKCLILCWCLPFRVVSSNCWRSNLVQPKRPKTVQSPEWSGLTVLHPT